MNIAVLSQPLRQKQAAQYLSSLAEHEIKVVVTRDTSRLDHSLFPADTRYFAWERSGVDVLSPRSFASKLVDHGKRFVASGSPMASRIGRWLRAADWRLRYLDRLQSMVLAKREEAAFDAPSELVSIIDSLLAEGAQIVVADLFDLPAVMKASSVDADIKVI